MQVNGKQGYLLFIYQRGFKYILLKEIIVSQKEKKRQQQIEW